ncbi:hypothetical protein BG011_005056 [Mortierella polycephala]|uniref:Uncharacterized protein n=1 Tax=Mortierella polycephala TaxID=41804 RepID=A0A9P6U1H7_9FUNG|nr:hypothetical protein BG011_005056 [Mortierella polycephala]
MLGHPSLFKHLICPILLTIIWGIAVFIFGFAYLLKIQAHALIRANCPAAVAWIVCIIFVLLEVGVLSILFYLIILPIYQDGLFDRVLKLRGFRHVLKKNEGNDLIKCMRGVSGGLWILLFQILVLIITLPVNLIPILGQMIFATVNGWVLTFSLRFHYDAEIRDISVLQSRREAWQRRSEYTGFGAIAVGLEMIPLANILFVWTNIVGAALWVADEIEEKEERMQQEQAAQSLMGPGRISPEGSYPAAYPSQQNAEQYSLQQPIYPPHYQQQHATSFAQPSTDPFALQGSARIPPKDKKHPDVY